MEAHTLERPVLAVDVVILKIKKGQLNVLLSQRTEEPFQGVPALPGVAVQIDETLEDAARRTLQEKIHWKAAILKEVYIEQLATFDALYRDPRGRTVSVAYMGLMRDKPEDEHGGLWQGVSDLATGTLPFDHDEILQTAVTRLQGKIRYTNLAKCLLPDTFRIEEIQAVYESILGKKLNRTNFRNKLLNITCIERVRILNEAVSTRGGRPPHLYRFTPHFSEAIWRDFL